MVDDRGGYYDRSERQDYGRDNGPGRDDTYSSARDYAAAGQGGDRSRDGRPYGQREYGNERYDQRERMRGGQPQGGGRGYDARDSGYYGGGDADRGSYASDGRRFAQEGRDRGRDDDRGFLARAGDEVRSWFGDDDGGRRRDAGEVENGRRVQGKWAGDPVHDHRDRHYHSWRESQIAALDQDYDEYRREHQSKFENEFSSWRTGRQTQRQMLAAVDEHQEVLGSDGVHVGTVDKVRGDRIVLTKNDADAGGRHHSVPSSWLQSVEGGKVTLSKSADEAKRAWRDEERQGERQGAMFGQEADRPQPRADVNDRDDAGRQTGGAGMLNRSFSGTY